MTPLEDLEAEYLDLIRYSDQLFRRDFISNKGCETIKIFHNHDYTLSIVIMVNGIVIEIKRIV